MSVKDSSKKLPSALWNCRNVRILRRTAFEDPKTRQPGSVDFLDNVSKLGITED